MQSWRRLTLVSIACCARLASAQVTLADDFDGADAGWDLFAEPFPGQTVRLEAAAAVSGALGLQFDDQHSDAGSGNGPAIGRFFDGVGDQFVRAWWRVTPQTGADQNISFVDLLADSAFGTAVEVKWNPSTSSVFNICFDGAGQFVAPLASFPLDAGFHLIEASGRNMGTANGQCQLAIDGVLVETKPVDFSAERWALLTIGPVYGEYAWTGTMHFDSVIAGPTPAPSRLELFGTGPLALGVCEYVKLTMTESFTNGPATLPWPTQVDLQVLGAETFSDPACTVPATTIVAPADVAYVRFYVRPDSLSLSVIARSPELMPLAFQSTVDPEPPDAGPPDAGPLPAHDGGSGPLDDGGTVELDGGDTSSSDGGTAPRDGRRQGLVSCGCSTIGPEWLLLALWAVRRSGRATGQ